MFGSMSPMIGKDFISQKEFIVGVLISVVIVLLVCMPFFSNSIRVLEKWTSTVPLPKRKIYLSMNIKISLSFMVSIVTILFVYLLSINNAISSLEAGQGTIQSMMIKNIVLASVCLIYSIINLLALLRQISSPVKETVSMLEEINNGEGDLTKRLEIVTRDELGVLMNSFNIFAETLKELLKELKLALLGSLHRRIILKTPMQRI